MQSSLRFYSVVIVLLAVFAPCALSQRHTEDFKLVASDGQTQDSFGYSIAVDGDVAVFGAPFVDTPNVNCGAAYVFRYDPGSDSWLEEEKLINTAGGDYDYFGAAVAVEGGVIMVGSATGYGRVDVFRYDLGSSSWVLYEVLEPAGNGQHDRFGCSIGLEGDTVVIGCEDDDDNGYNSGSAFVFRYDAGSDSYVEEAQLLASDGAASDSFGYDVALSGDLAVVGAYESDAQGDDSGSAYLFRYDPGSGTWSEEAKLLAWDGTQYENFGFSVAVDNDTVLIGAPKAKNYLQLENTGVAYTFQYDGTIGEWIGKNTILHKYSAQGDFFGCSVALFDDVALIGARYADGMQSGSGEAYAFHYYDTLDNWVLAENLRASDSLGGEHFGGDVALQERATAFVGARMTTNGSTVAAGAVYGFDLPSHRQPQTLYVPDDFTTINDALYNSDMGDEIIVRPGTYMENLSFPDDWSVALRSEYGSALTVIDGGQNSSTIYMYRVGSSLIDGFTVTNGAGWDHPTLGRVGGGIYCAFSTPTFRNCVIMENHVEDYWAEGAWGGGLFMGQCHPKLINNIISNNSAEWTGDAFYSHRCSTLMVNNTVTGNGETTNYGAALVFDNSRGVVVNSLVWYNYGWESYLYTDSIVDFTYTNLEGGISSVGVDTGSTLDWGAGMISDTPGMADSINGDFHLKWTSACRDSGSSGAPGFLTRDFEGDPRPADGIADMGADEFHVHLYGLGDVIPGGPIDVCIVGEPGRSVTLGQGGNILGTPIQTAHGLLYMWPVVNKWPFGAVPSTGIRVVNATVPVAWVPGTEYPFQAHVGAWGDPSTLLTNLMVLIAE